MPAKYEPVVYDKSIYRQEDGTFLLVVREDGDVWTLPRDTLEEAQMSSDALERDHGEPFWYDDVWNLLVLSRLNQRGLNGTT